MKEITILELLTKGGSQYALDLVNKSNGQLSHRVLLVLLNRMEENKLVCSWNDQPPKMGKGYIGLTRKLYKITSLGETFLRTFGAREQKVIA